MNNLLVLPPTRGAGSIWFDLVRFRSRPFSDKHRYPDNTSYGDAKISSHTGGATVAPSHGSATRVGSYGSARLVDSYGECKPVTSFGSARVVFHHGDATLIEIPMPPSSSGKWILVLVGGVAIGLTLLVPGAMLMFATTSTALATEMAAVGAFSTLATSMAIAAPLASKIAAGALIGSGTSAVMYPLTGGDDWGELGTAILCGAVEGAVTAGFSGPANTATAATKTTLKKRVAVAATGRVASQVTSNAVHGRPVTHKVIDAAVAAALSAGISHRLGDGKEIKIGGVFAEDNELLAGAACQILAEVGASIAMSVMTNSTSNLMRREEFFANTGEAIWRGAVSGAVSGAIDAAMSTYVRVEQRAIAKRSFQAARAQLAVDGGPGGLQALALYCGATDQSAVVFDTNGNLLAEVRNGSASDTVYLRFESGDEHGHYTRLCPETLQPLPDTLKPYSAVSCLSDALEITPEELAACFTAKNARKVFGDNMTLEHVLAIGRELIGGGKKHRPDTAAKTQNTENGLRGWVEDEGGIFVREGTNQKSNGKLLDRNSRQRKEDWELIETLVKRFDKHEKALCQPIEGAVVDGKKQQVGNCKDTSLCHFFFESKGGSRGEFTVTPGQSTRKTGLRLDMLATDDKTAVYNIQVDGPKHESSTLCSVTTSTEFGNKNRRAILDALVRSYQTGSIVYIADKKTKHLVERHCDGEFP